MIVKLIFFNLLRFFGMIRSYDPVKATRTTLSFSLSTWVVSLAAFGELISPKRWYFFACYASLIILGEFLCSIFVNRWKESYLDEISKERKNKASAIITAFLFLSMDIFSGWMLLHSK